MWSPSIVESQVSGEAFAGDRDAVIGAQVDLFIFDAAPQSFDEHFIPPCALTVPLPGRVCIANPERDADLDVSILQHLGTVDGCELGALIRVHDLGLVKSTDRLVQCLDA